jgi:hypothetical protein
MHYCEGKKIFYTLILCSHFALMTLYEVIVITLTLLKATNQMIVITSTLLPEKLFLLCTCIHAERLEGFTVKRLLHSIFSLHFKRWT